MLSPGNLDLYVQVNEPAIKAVLAGVVAGLKQAGMATQRTNFSWGYVQLDLTSLDVTNIRAVNPNDRFAYGGTLASFAIKAAVSGSFYGFPFTDTVEVDVDDLAVGIATSAGGLPTGISLGFGQFSVQVTGFGPLDPFINDMLKLQTMYIQLVLGTMKMNPIPIHQMGDGFAKMGLSFAANYPVIGPSLAGANLVAAADFNLNGSYVSELGALTDLIPPGSTMTAATQVNQRLANKVIAAGTAKGSFQTMQTMGGTPFYLTSPVALSFQTPTPGYAATLLASFSSQGKVKNDSCGFLAGLFGSKKVNVNVYSTVTLDASIVAKPPPATGSNLVFDFEIQSRAKVSIGDIFGPVLGIVLGPQLYVVEQLCGQVSNAPLPPQVVTQVSQSPANPTSLTVTLQNKQTSTTLVSVQAQAVVAGQGVVDLDQAMQQLANPSSPVNVSFPPDSLASQSLPSSNGDGDLLLGARVTT